MRNKKAKAIRRIVYNGQKPQPKYVRFKSEIKGAINPILNVGEMEQISDKSTGESRKIPRRRMYQFLKKISRKIPINELKKVFLNENPKGT